MYWLDREVAFRSKQCTQRAWSGYFQLPSTNVSNIPHKAVSKQAPA